VNPRYAAVQYALLASLTMLIGTLGRGALGQLIETQGFAYVFVLTALLGLVAVAASAGEAARSAWLGRSQSGKVNPDGTATEG
jgi:PAT family beta-lactamase induction signal transducer AmpG